MVQEFINFYSVRVYSSVSLAQAPVNYIVEIVELDMVVLAPAMMVKG
ncbi:MAG: hypothetical protein CM15mP65_21650 [Crocinitomicaceae bacterium]|nr:MAG: hypothetical protein CM15mP65_21650 [Crocinitomicaceae bacterium]